MFFNVSDDLAMKNDPNSTYICAMSQSSQNILWPPTAKVGIDKVKNVFLAEINFLETYI